jgi:hypothetical protein
MEGDTATLITFDGSSFEQAAKNVIEKNKTEKIRMIFMGRFQAIGKMNYLNKE